jgi:hypothetical protein
MAGPSLGWTAGFTLANNQNAPFEPLLAAWNGHRWRTVPVNLGKGVSGRLDGLADQSPDNAWAVGTAYVGSDSSRPLILHWNGRQWTRVPGAGVPGFGYVSLLRGCGPLRFRRLGGGGGGGGRKIRRAAGDRTLERSPLAAHGQPAGAVGAR